VLTSLRKCPESLILIMKMMKNTLKFVTALLVLSAVSAALTGCRGYSPAENAPEKAAIIDQLYILEPNPSFVDNTTRLLESCGFTVDLWQGSEVTVDFYRKLPAMGYKLIIFRVHSGLLEDSIGGKEPAAGTTYLFTSENYSTIKYIRDQLTDKVSNAMVSDKMPLVFAVNPAFIKSAGGRFGSTVVIMMGCESYYNDDMPEAFIEKGAAAYVGWSAPVGLEYVDNATLDLLENLCARNLPLEEGIEKTMDDAGPDPDFGAYLRYYPPSSGNRTVNGKK
jgi:hypothetical protein